MHHNHHPLGPALSKSLHCLPIQPTHQQLVYEDITALIVKSITKVQVDNVCISPLIYQTAHFIIETYKVGQAWFPVGESLLTTSDDFLDLHVPGNGFWDYLLHLLPRDRDEAAQPLVPHVLLALFCRWE